MRLRPPQESDFTSGLRGPAVATRVGRWLGICFAVCFITGVFSHYAQAQDQPLPIPTSPAWGYAATQALHVLCGTACVPLLLVKLWTVYPRLFATMPRPGPGLLGALAERGSIAVLVASSLFLLSTGLANITQWYPWDFSFRRSHHALAWVAIGALLIHIGTKLPLIRDALSRDVEQDPDHSPEQAQRPSPVTRRGLLRSTALAAVSTAVLVAGGTLPALDRFAWLSARRTGGPDPSGVPVNRTARAAGVVVAATAPDWSCEVVYGASRIRLTRADLEALDQHTVTLPIACVEGWSASGEWTGVRVSDVVALVGAPPEAEVAVHSLQRRGGGRFSVLPAHVTADGRTLVALGLAGRPLSLDHGFPARLIAPNRPGVLQTKWLARLEVVVA